MNNSPLLINSFIQLKKVIQQYAPISEQTWQAVQNICTFSTITKGGFFCHSGKIPRYFGFVVSGLLRTYITDEKGNEYNKMFFPENTFPGSMVALLTNSISKFTIESLETSYLLQIDFNVYRELLMNMHDLKFFHIHYLERNWLIDKEQREIMLVHESATNRYLHFTQTYPELLPRLSQYHIASHLGITATQLSRIRKKLTQK